MGWSSLGCNVLLCMLQEEDLARQALEPDEQDKSAYASGTSQGAGAEGRKGRGARRDGASAGGVGGGRGLSSADSHDPAAASGRSTAKAADSIS